METWKNLERTREHSLAKNKNLEAIFITEENAQRISDEYQVFSVMGKSLLLGVMHFQRMPVWMICINPKSHKKRKYIFESESTFERYFEIIEEEK